MKCFNHYNNDAVSTCTSCGKALCQECLKEYNNVVICKDSIFCAERSDMVMKTFDSNKKMLRHNSKMLLQNEKLMKGYKALGLIFILTGLFYGAMFISELASNNVNGAMGNLIPIVVSISMSVLFYRQQK